MFKIEGLRGVNKKKLFPDSNHRIYLPNNDQSALEFLSIGTTCCWTVANSAATRLQWLDATGRCDKGTHSVRMRCTTNAREAFTKFDGSGTARTSCYGTNSTSSQEGETRMSLGSTTVGVAQDAAIALSLQVANWFTMVKKEKLKFPFGRSTESNKSVDPFISIKRHSIPRSNNHRTHSQLN